jgi:phosphatidylglycerophosphate synthase
VLIKLRVTPNKLTLTGMVLTALAGFCYAAGSGSRFAWSFSTAGNANCYLLLAAALLILSSACDMLDGAVARIGNLTYVLLCMLAVGNAFLISYTRARAHEAGGTCTVGYWQRGERMAAVLIATAAHNIPALVLQQALLTLPTVLRRIFHAKAVLEGKHPITDPRLGGWWLKVRLWRWPRMTIPYDLVTGLNIAWLIFARVPANDYLRWWLG